MSLHLHIGSVFKSYAHFELIARAIALRNQNGTYSVTNVKNCQHLAQVRHMHVEESDVTMVLQIVQCVDAPDGPEIHLYGQNWPWLCDLACCADSVEKVDGCSGKVWLYLGCMFAGKSATAIHTVRRLKKVQNAKILVVSHRSDTRYQDEGIVSHDLDQIAATRARHLMDLVQDPQSGYNAAQYVIVEEAQFFPDLLEFILRIRADDKHVFVFGLDGTAHRKPFGEVCRMIGLATNVTKLTAMCHVCTETPTKAPFTHCWQPLPPDGVLVGGSDTYIAMCRKHWLAANQSL